MGWVRNHFRAAIEVARVRPDYLGGLRAAAATILPLVFGELHGAPGFIWTALGGWLATIADTGGAMGARAAAMGWFAFWGSLAVVLGAAIGGHTAISVVVLFAGALLAGIARVRGENAAATGTLALITLCVALGTPAASLDGAALRAAFFAAGAVYALVLSLAIWAVHPFKPARDAVAGCYAALAELVDGVRDLAERGAPEEAWHELMRTRRPRVRAAIELSRAVLASIRRERETASRRGELLVLLASLAESALGTLTALTEALHTAERVALVPLAKAYAAVAVAIRTGDAPEPLLLPEISGKSELEVLLRELHAQAHVAYEYVALLARRVRGPRVPLPATWLGPTAPPRLRDVLRPNSIVLQHALRVATATAAAMIFARLAHLHRAHWVTVTVVIILQPSAGATFGRALSRILGTLVGAIAAALLAPLVHGPLSVTLILFPLSMLAIALRPLNYGLYAFLVTPVFVLIAETGHGAVADRIVDTLVGGLFALVGAFALWRVREREQLPQHLSRLFTALRAYADAALRGSDERAAVAARRDTGLAAANADASLQRLLSESHSVEVADAGMEAVALARRISGSITAIRATGAMEPERVELIERALRELADAVAQRKPPAAAPVAPDGATALWTRLDRQLAQARGAVTRLVSVETR